MLKVAYIKVFQIEIIQLVRTQNFLLVCVSWVRNFSFLENFVYLLDEWTHIFETGGTILLSL